MEQHVGITSSLTCYEVEEALYRAIRGSEAGEANTNRFIIPAARAVITQTLMTIDLFKIVLVDLTAAVVNAQCGNLELQKRGIRAADALHITTALSEDAHVFITTDSDLIRLDDVFESDRGIRLRCVDTDQAIALLA